MARYQRETPLEQARRELREIEVRFVAQRELIANQQARGRVDPEARERYNRLALLLVTAQRKVQDLEKAGGG